MKKVGICNAIEKYLLDNGPKTYRDILRAMEELRYSQSSVSGSLSTLRRMRRISYDEKPRRGKYSIRVHTTTEKPGGLRSFVYTFKPLRTNMFSNWDNCVRAPRDPVRDVVSLIR